MPIWNRPSGLWRTLSETTLPGVACIVEDAGLNEAQAELLVDLCKDDQAFLREMAIDVNVVVHLTFVFFCNGAASPSVDNDHDGGDALRGAKHWLRRYRPTAFNVLQQLAHPDAAAAAEKEEGGGGTLLRPDSPVFSTGGKKRARVDAHTMYANYNGSPRTVIKV